MKRLALVALALALCARPSLRAQQHETEAQRVADSKGNTEHGEPELLWGWANFILLAAGLGYLIKKNVGPYFAQRSQQIKQGMAEADVARAESEAKVAEVERRIANLQSEVAAMRATAEQEATAEVDRARREAAAELAKIQQHLTEEIASATKSARLELRRYSAELALSLAEKKIAAGMTPQTEDRLVRTFIATMAHAGQNN